jgi:hypothetical protein
VDGLELDLAGQVDVIRLDILTGLGRSAAALYGVRAVPTLLVVDGQGQIAHQTAGIPTDPGLVRAAALALTGQKCAYKPLRPLSRATKRWATELPNKRRPTVRRSR